MVDLILYLKFKFVEQILWTKNELNHLKKIWIQVNRHLIRFELDFLHHLHKSSLRNSHNQTNLVYKHLGINSCQRQIARLSGYIWLECPFIEGKVDFNLLRLQIHLVTFQQTFNHFETLFLSIFLVICHGNYI